MQPRINQLDQLLKSLVLASAVGAQEIVDLGAVLRFRWLGGVMACPRRLGPAGLAGQATWKSSEGLRQAAGPVVVFFTGASLSEWVARRHGKRRTTP
ncbi:MAG: hypothetical protein AAGM22_31790, partial [Acidobacteriota bacterium]